MAAVEVERAVGPSEALTNLVQDGSHLFRVADISMNVDMSERLPECRLARSLLSSPGAVDAGRRRRQCIQPFDGDLETTDRAGSVQPVTKASLGGDIARCLNDAIKVFHEARGAVNGRCTQFVQSVVWILGSGMRGHG